MKKTTRILPLVFSVLLLLVFVTAIAHARSNQNPTPFEIKAQIRWKKDMGLIPIGPGKILASNSACSPFFIVAYEYDVSVLGGRGILATSRSTSQPTEQEGYYVCDYSMQVPRDKAMFVRAGMGDVALLPKTLHDSEDRLMPRQPYLTDPWIGGTNSRPPAGWERGFDRRPISNVGLNDNRHLEFVLWEMFYFKSDSDPNPSSTSEKGPSPILRRASSFAGAWQGKLGESYIELVLQQAGDRVTGQLNLNSNLFGLKNGIVAGNTLRFKIVRTLTPNGAVVPDGSNLPGLREEWVGSGELVMDADGKSFNGTVFNAATRGTLIRR